MKIPDNFLDIYYSNAGDDLKTAEVLGVSDRMVRYYWQATKDKYHVREISDPIILPFGDTIKYYGNAVVAGDLHVPLQDEKMIDMVCSESLGMPCLIINGDFFNLDEFSPFPDKQRSADWKTEKNEAMRIIRKLLLHFAIIIIIEGNHCKRWPTRNFQDLKDMLVPDSDKDRVYFIAQDSMIVNGNWLITHSGHYSKIPARVAEDLAKLHKMKNFDVIHAHTHLLGWKKVEKFDSQKGIYYNEKYTAISGGHCCDETIIDYKKKRTTKHTPWKQGFVVLRNNQFEIKSPEPPMIRTKTYIEMEIY